VGLLAQPWQSQIINSINFGFLLVVFVLFTKKINLKTTGIVLLFMCYFFPYHLDGIKLIPYLSSADKSEINKHNLDDTINIKDFKFINQNLDTVLLDMNKPILVETWNETCRPCMASIKGVHNKVSHNVAWLKNQQQHLSLFCLNNGLFRRKIRPC